MKYYLGVTDNNWYRFLAQKNAQQGIEDINFWQPSGRTSFKVLVPGEPFLFKLKSPLNAIGGVAFFASHSILPLEVAWDIFQERNGVASYITFRNTIRNYRDHRNPFDQNPNVGCIVLTDPIFFAREDWIPTPNNWGKSIVQGKSYTTDDTIGATLWQQVEQRLQKYQLYERAENYKNQLMVEEPQAPYGAKKYLTKVRLGQGAFRVRLTEAYQRRCAFSGEKTLPALEAAHIKPYAESGPHQIANGLLLRADLHKLFDTGYLTLTTDYKIEVSAKIKEEFDNGKDYYKLHGNGLYLLPQNEADKPGAKYIEWHQEEVYRG